MMKRYILQIRKDREDVSQVGATELVRAAQAAIAERGSFRVALSGGSTPRRLYELLTEPPLRMQVDWSKVHFFWSDERPVGPDDPESNYRMAHETLLSKLPLQPEQIHRLQGEAANLDEAALAYQKEIATVFAVSPLAEPPQFDLILLGLGPDGHTASLFPATPALHEIGLWVVRNPVLKLGGSRLTFTAGIINSARKVIFLVSGADKASILAEVLEGPIDKKRLPAQMIRPLSGPPLWLVDQAAAEKLKGKG